MILTKTPPKHRGEYDVYLQLSARDFGETFFWFSLDFIPGVSDIDLLIWDKTAGLFVVEIKAIPQHMLISLSYSTCEISGRGLDRSPQYQAYDAGQSLRNFLEPKITKVPFVTATVCWPLISREEWKANFSTQSDIAELADSFLMLDEINSTSQILTKRLQKISGTPPIRKASAFKFRHDESIFRELTSSLDPQGIPSPPKSDLDKLESLERALRKDILRAFPPKTHRRAIFSGKPGTGKTFRLLQIGLLHAREGCRVLLTCFNRVLAADLQRTIELLSTKWAGDMGPGLKNNFKVLDIFALTAGLSSDIGVEIQLTDWDEWGELIVAEYSRKSIEYSHLKFDTILIDEAQDFKEWQIQLIQTLLQSESTLAVGIGGNQELYRDRVNHLNETDLLRFDSFNTFQLKKNFRNCKTIYQLAHLLFETRLDIHKIDSVYRRTFLKKRSEEPEVEFELNQRRLPALHLVDDLVVKIDSPEFVTKRDQLIVGHYADIIQKNVASLDGGMAPRDLLVLVPDTNGSEANYVRQALVLVEKSSGIAHIDYVNDKHRRRIAPSNSIRFVTFHSSRGLDAANVICFGLSQIKDLSRQLNIAPENLGYIVLSRAIFDLTIVQRLSTRNEITDFIESALQFLDSSNPILQ